MNKLNVYKKVFQEVREKFDGVEDFIKEKIEEICNNERLRQLLKLELVVFVKILQLSF